MGRGNKNLKIIAATSMTVFSLLTCFMGAYAWFGNARNQATTGDNFAVSVIDHTINAINFYPFDSFKKDANDVSYYAFSSTPIGGVTIDGDTATYTGSFMLGKLNGGNENIFDIDDPHHPILMLMEVGGAEANIRVHTEQSYLGTFSEPYSRNDSTHFNPLSSVVQFHSVPFASSGSGSLSSRQATFANCISVAESELTESNFSSFVTITNGEYVEGSFKDTAVLYSDSVAGYSYVGVIIDYYAPSIEYIYSHFLGHAALSDGLTFKCDWETIL